MKKHTRRPDATDIWIAQNVKPDSKGRPPKTPRLTFSEDYRTVADVYKDLLKKGNTANIALIADIPYKEPEEESQSQSAIEQEIETPPRRAQGKSRKPSKTQPKGKPSPKIKKEPVSTSKRAAIKQAKTTPTIKKEEKAPIPKKEEITTPIKEEEMAGTWDNILGEEDRSSDGNISDEVRSHTA